MQRRRPPVHLARQALEFDNSGKGPLIVPGFAHIPSFIEVGIDERFTHTFQAFRSGPMRATAREIAMLRVMERVTEQQGWHEDVYSEEKLALWEDEARKTDLLISDKAWAWCVLELRDKAKQFVKTGRTIVLDYTAGVCKVDLLTGLQNHLKVAVDKVVEMDVSKGQPGSVAHIIDPYLAPLVYGQTRVLSEGGIVDLQDMHRWYFHGVLSQRREIWIDIDQLAAEAADTPDDRKTTYGYSYWKANRDPNEISYRRICSPGFQWLPCEVAFTSESPGVCITSYINDLHPHKHTQLYVAIEKVIAAAIAPWNDILVRSSEEISTIRGQGRIPARIRTYGVQYPISLPALELDLRGFSNLTTPTSANKADLAVKVKEVENEIALGFVGSAWQARHGQ
jgi:hypothetical protein